MVWGVKKFKPYLEGYRFDAVTDHIALKWLVRLKEPTGRLARWVLELQQYDFEVVYRKGIANKVADALSRYPVGQVDLMGFENQVSLLSAAYVSGNGQTETGERNDTWYKRLCNRITKNPDKFHNFTTRNGKLYRLAPKNGARSNRGTTKENWKMCVPQKDRDAVMKETHDSPTAGHFGFKKTAKKIAENYYWPGWRKEVRRYVRNCPTCQAYKVEQVKPAGKMHFRTPVGPWHTISADLLGPFPRSKRGNRFIIAFQDQYSKWTELAPLRSATATPITQKFKELILLRFGTPEVLIIDNGTQFGSLVFQNMLKYWGIESFNTAPYSPQANPIERRNRVLKTLIAQSVKGDHRTWDESLNEITFAVNTAVHESTQFTPAMLCFGRELRVPGALSGPNFELVEGEEPTEEQVHHERLERFRKLYQKTQENLRKAYARHAKYYNLRRRDVSYTEGQEVLRRTHVLSSAANAISSKLAPKYDGPFLVIKRVGYNLYVIRKPNSRKTERAHVKDLKPFHR